MLLTLVPQLTVIGEIVEPLGGRPDWLEVCYYYYYIFLTTISWCLALADSLLPAHHNVNSLTFKLPHSTVNRDTVKL